MGAVFAAAARAPITAVIIIFELTGDYRIILPLMFAIALAAGVSNILSEDTIYTLKLRRRGIDITRGRGPNPMQLLRVSDAMQPLPPPLPADMRLDDAIEHLADATADGLPVVDDEGRYIGTLTSQQLEESMRENTLGSTAGELAQALPALSGDQTLEEALAELLRAHAGLPVVEGGDGTPVGWITHVDVLRAYARLSASAGSRDRPSTSPDRATAR
jgi:CIC family chloride channel protein